MMTLQSYHVLFHFLLYLFHEKDVRGSSCHTPHDSAGCMNQICKNLVCQTNPECCDLMWDLHCAKIACYHEIYMDGHLQNGICQSIGTACTVNNDRCHNIQHSLAIGCHNLQCANTICEIKPECCDNSWDMSCVELACDINHGVCNHISGACIGKTQTETLSKSLPHEFQQRHLLQHCSNDPCPGHQQRNPTTCSCECASSDNCSGNQELNPSCECGCVVTPICQTPKQFNPILCDCECITTETCNTVEIFNTGTCLCETVPSNSNVASDAVSICPSEPCPGGIQKRNANTCECECEVSITECPGNQDFNILCECQCVTTPICNAQQQFNPINCSCECIQTDTCDVNQIWNSDQCQCDNDASVITPTVICSSDPCPGHLIRDPTSCDCECENAVQCTGNQVLNVICECGCAVTPICSTLQQFNTELCACECRDITSDVCGSGEILNTNTCSCEVVQSIATTNPPITNPPTTVTPTTDAPTTNIPTTLNPTTISPTTSSPTTSSPTTSSVLVISTTFHTLSPTTDRPTATESAYISSSNPPTTSTPSSLPTYNQHPSTTTLQPTNTPSVSSYTIVKSMISRLDTDFDVLEEYLEIENLSIYEWADAVIKILIHYDDPIISDLVMVNIVNIESGSIAIIYNLVIQRVEIFDIVLYNMDSTQYVTFRDFVFPVLSNEVITDTQNDICAAIGELCDGVMSCCDADKTIGILCIARSDAHTNHGVCCIDYNNDGCSHDSDCCYDNSYCDLERGKCVRNHYQRYDASGRYDASDSKEESVSVDDIDREQSDAALLLPKQNHSDHDYTYIQVFDIKGIVVSPSLQLLLVIVVILMIGNVMCCMHEKWAKMKKAKKRKSCDRRTSAKQSVDINII